MTYMIAFILLLKSAAIAKPMRHLVHRRAIPLSTASNGSTAAKLLVNFSMSKVKRRTYHRPVLDVLMTFPGSNFVFEESQTVATTNKSQTDSLKITKMMRSG